MTIDDILDTANRIAGHPSSGPIREFINQLADALRHEPSQPDNDEPRISEHREQQTLH